MKKKYLQPIMDIEQFSLVDVLNASDDGVLDFNEDWLSGGDDD